MISWGRHSTRALNIYHVQGSVDTAVDKTEQDPVLKELKFWWGRQTINMYFFKGLQMLLSAVN